MVGRHRRGEEGQVYPALLLAVIGGFAIAVAFIALQDLLDQGARAASASDSAALAVGNAQRDNVVSLFAADPAGRLEGFLGFLRGSGTPPTAAAVAEEYASSNGADLSGTVDYQGFDTGRRSWLYRVVTRQQDTVSGGSRTARSRSASRVSVSITGGLCSDLSGIEVGGRCIRAEQYAQDCVAPPPPPDPTTPPSGGPKPTPTPEPEPFEPAGYCGVGLDQLLQWRVALVN